MKAFLAVVLLAAAVAAEVVCPAEQESNWDIELLLRHEDCNKFYKCTHGAPVEQDCFGDLYFNLDTWQCDYPENVDCNGRNDPAENKDESKEASEEKPDSVPIIPIIPIEPEEESEEKPDSVPIIPIIPIEPEEESEEKPDSVPIIPIIPIEPEEQSEEKPDSVPIIPIVPIEPEQESEEKSAETEESEECEEESDAEQPSEIEFLENGCPVDPHIHWLLPHESDCNMFYYCVWGEKEVRSCASSLHFNPVIQVCDWPWEAGCATSANRHFGARDKYFRGL